MMRTFLAALFVGYPLLIGATCLAATIEPVQGELSINQGEGFEKINGRIDASVGDSVMVSPNGSAIVSYPDGCQVNVQPGAVTTIAPISPCAAGSYALDQNQSYSVAPTLVFGAAAVGTLGVIGYEISQSAKAPPPQPASP